MKDMKYRFESLCIYDYRGVEERLSAMAAQGWRLEKAGNAFWRYYRAEPKQVRYAVTYNDGASQFNPGPTEGQRSLAELCEAAGWRKVCDWFQMQIFCTEDPCAVPLETDEALRLENIHRSMRKNFLPANMVLLALGLLMSISFLGTLFTNPLRIFERNASFLTGPLFILLALLEIYTLFHYYRWRRKSRQSIGGGGPCASINTRFYQRMNRWGLILVAVLVLPYLLMEFFSGGKRYLLLLLLYMALFCLLSAAVRQTTALLRKRGVSKWGNIAGTLAVDVVLAFALVGGLAYGAIRLLGNDGGETYEYQGWQWDASPEEGFPLAFSDITGQTYGHVDRLHFQQGSFFLPERKYMEAVLWEERTAGLPDVRNIDYTIWDPKFHWLTNALVEEETAAESHPGLERRYEPEDPAPWGAEAVYRRYLDGNAMDAWLLVWPKRVVLLGLEEAPTDRQKAVIGARLAPGT